MPGFSFKIYKIGGTCATGNPSGNRIAENTVSPDITLYPNPAAQEFTLSFGQIDGQIDGQTDWKETTIVISDLTGKTLFSLPKQDLSANSILHFDTFDWAAGVYLVQIHSNNSFYNYKLIIVK